MATAPESSLSAAAGDPRWLQRVRVANLVSLVLLLVLFPLAVP